MATGQSGDDFFPLPKYSNIPLPSRSTIRSHLYEQLPSAQYESGEYEYPTSMDKSPSVSSMHRLLSKNPAVFNEDGSGGGRLNSHTVSCQVSGGKTSYQNYSYRKRENPLYQSVSEMTSKSAELKNSSRLTCMSLILAAFASLLSIITFGITVFNKEVTKTSGSELKLIVLQHKFDLMMEQLAAVKYELPMLKEKNAELTNQSMLTHSQLYDELIRMHDNLSGQISNMTKQTGPRGPPGAGNLTACEYKSLYTANPAVLPESLTVLIPKDITGYKAAFITGVTCSTDSGSLALLDSTTTQGFTQFQCRCSGHKIMNATSRRCYVHYWSCPRNS